MAKSRMLGGLSVKNKFKTLSEVLQYHAEHTPHDIVYTFLSENQEDESITYQQLYQRSIRLAAHLLEKGVQEGERCILMYQQEKEFIVGFFACNMIGAIAVPVDMPTQIDNIEKWVNIIENCESKVILTNKSSRKDISQLFADKIHVYSEQTCHQTQEVESLEIVEGRIAFLQYTSGSTSLPKGVMVSNYALLNNLGQISEKMDCGKESRWVTWAPYYHDMGLVMGFLTAIYTGGHNIVMSPQYFRKNPMIWFEAITRYRGTHTVASNFAFELLSEVCADICLENEIYLPKDVNGLQLDLSSLVRILTAGEPVRFHTMLQFMKSACQMRLNEKAIVAAYGLAEATLCVTINDNQKKTSWIQLDKKSLCQNEINIADQGTFDLQVDFAQEKQVDYTYLMGNGTAMAESKVFILDQDGKALPPMSIGEICVISGSLADGYWKNDEETANTFVQDQNGNRILHTGDVGFFHSDGELYITGRLKEMIVIRGVNYYPSDLEQLSSKADERLSYAACVFSESSEEEDSLVMIQEVGDNMVTPAELESIANLIRIQILNSFQLSINTVVFTEKNRIPRTISGKIVRKRAKQEYLEHTLDILYISDGEADFSQFEKYIQEHPIETEEDIISFITNMVSRLTKIETSSIDTQETFMRMGINSKLMVRFVLQVNKCLGTNLEVADAFNYNTIVDLSEYIYELLFLQEEKNGEDYVSMNEDEILTLLEAELLAVY